MRLQMGLDLKIPTLTLSFDKIENLDWGKIDAIDVEKLKSGGDKSILLKELLPQLIQFNPEETFPHQSDPEPNVQRFRKVFQLSQITLEALLSKLNEVESSYVSMEAKFAELSLEKREKETESVRLRKKLEFVKRELNRRKQNIALKQNGIMNGKLDEYEQCPYCAKRFLARIYLLSHIQRRHQGLLSLEPQQVTAAPIEVGPIPKVVSSGILAPQANIIGNQLNIMSASFQQFLNEQQRKNLSPEPKFDVGNDIPIRRRRSVHEAESTLLEKAEEVESRWKTVLAKLNFTKEDDLNDKIKKLKLDNEDQNVGKIDKEIQCGESKGKLEQKPITVLRPDKEIKCTSSAKMKKLQKTDKKIQYSPQPEMLSLEKVVADKEIQCTPQTQLLEFQKTDKEIQCSPQPARSTEGNDTFADAEIQIQKLGKTLQQRQCEIDELRGILEKKSQENMEMFQQKLEITENSWKLKTQLIETEYGKQIEKMKQEFQNTLANVEYKAVAKENKPAKQTLKLPSPPKQLKRNIPIPKPRNVRKMSPEESISIPSPIHHEYEEPVDVRKETQVLEHSNSVSCSFYDTESNHSLLTLTGEGEINEDENWNPKHVSEMDQVRTKVLQNIDDQLSSLENRNQISNCQLLETDMSKALGRLKQSRQSLEKNIDNFTVDRIHLNQQATSFAHRKILENKLCSPKFPKSRRLNLVNTTTKKSPLTKMYQGLKRKGTSLKLMLQRKNRPSKQTPKKKTPLTLSTLFSKAPKKQIQGEDDEFEESEQDEELSDEDDFVMPMITKSRPIFENNATPRNPESSVVASDSEGSINPNKPRKHLWKNSELQRQAKEAIELSKVPVLVSPKSLTPNSSVRSQRKRSNQFRRASIKNHSTSISSSSFESSRPNQHLEKDDKAEQGNYVELVKPLKQVRPETKPNNCASTADSETEGAGDQKLPVPVEKSECKDLEVDTSASSGWDTNSYTPPQNVKKLGFQEQYNGPSTSGLQHSKPPNSRLYNKSLPLPSVPSKSTVGAKAMLGSWDSDSDRLI